MRHIISLFILFVEVLFIYGNNIPYPFSQYNYSYLTVDEGLPHNLIDDVFKDSQGYIWVATHDGLSRYDGYDFLTLNTNSKPLNLKSNFVHKICEDDFNRLWIASEGGIDIISLDEYNKVKLFEDSDSKLYHILNSYCRFIYKDKAGDIWIASENTLYCIELNKDGQINNYYSLEEDASVMPINSVVDLGWTVCVGINNSVMRINKRANNTLKVEPISKLVTNLAPNLNIHCMENDGIILWIGTNRGLFKYDHYGQKITQYQYSSQSLGTLSQSHITDIKTDQHGSLFVSTLKGLNLYDREKDTFVSIQQSKEYNMLSLNSNFINCLLHDGNNIWVGTEMGGINLLTRGRLITSNMRNNPSDKSSLSPNPVNAICEDNTNNLWVGTVDGGLNLQRKGESNFEHFVCNPKDKTTISHNTVSGLLLDSENHLWVYTWGAGINELDLNIANNRNFKRHQKRNDGVDVNFVASACEDIINKGIWFGTTEGLHFYDKQKGELAKVKFSQLDNKFETMPSLLIDHKNRLWVGTSDGLFIIDLFSFARSRIHFNYIHIRHKLSDEKSSTHDKINCIFQDKEKDIWLGGNGSGLYKLENDENGVFRFTNYTTDNGLPNNTIMGIVEDNNGYLWISSNKGVSQLDKKSLIFSNYTKYDGLLSNQCYWNAYLFSQSKNRVYFGTLEGLVVIKPEVVKNYNNHIKVLFTSLNILGNNILPHEGDYLNKAISCASEIRMHESDKMFSIGFSTKHYDYINQVRYAYRLKGYDNDWHETGIGENRASYTSIPPGKYTLQVKATDNQGYWSDEVSEIQIYITPYFYKSWWFLSLLLILVLLALQRFFTWKMNIYRRQNEVLEKTVEDRTGELVRKNEKLIEVSRKLANTTEERISFFTHIAHEFRTPVTLIKGPVENALKHTNDTFVKEQLQIAERNSTYLVNLVNELLIFRKLDESKVQLEKKSGNLINFMNYILMPFSTFASEKEIKLNVFYRLEAPFVVLDYEYMRKVIVNILGNALKFTQRDGTICVYVASLSSAKDNKKELYISVRDTGTGIPEKDTERIFAPFYQAENSRDKYELWQSGTGIGLSYCRKIIDMHNGSITAKNNKSKGASFRITMPYIEGDQLENTNEYESAETSSNSRVNLHEKNNETILVVDDNADMRTYIHSLLSKKYNVLEAQNGEEALSLIQDKSIDLILSDLMMPVMDGLELSRQVKANLSISHIPFLILTALVSDEQKKISYQIGVDEYLCKPFDEEILLLRIHSILDQRKKFKAQFLTTINSNDLDMKMESRNEKFMKSIINIMHENYSNPQYEVDSFVQDMGYSKTLVNKKLQELAGMSIGQYIRNYRLNIAKGMLTKLSSGADLNISEIAYSVGFNDPKYFTRCFKELFGVLPSSFLSKES